MNFAIKAITISVLFSFRGQIALTEESDFVEIVRGPCYGTCRQYSVRINADGSVQWHGIARVYAIGLASDLIPIDVATSTIQQLESVPPSRGTLNSTDGQVVRINGIVHGNSRSVTIESSNIPPQAAKVIFAIEAAAQTHKWRHGPAEKELFSSQASLLLEDALLPKPTRTELMRLSALGPSETKRIAKFGTNAAVEQDSSGWTPLMYSTVGPGTDNIDALLQLGADVNATSRQGQSALMAAAVATTNASEKVARLLRAGALVNARDSAGETALMLACDAFQDNASVIAALSQAGARKDIRDGQGRTALDHLQAAARRYGVWGEAYNAAKQLLQD